LILIIDLKKAKAVPTIAEVVKKIFAKGGSELDSPGLLISWQAFS